MVVKRCHAATHPASSLGNRSSGLEDRSATRCRRTFARTPGGSPIPSACIGEPGYRWGPVQEPYAAVGSPRPPVTGRAAGRPIPPADDSARGPRNGSRRSASRRRSAGTFRRARPGTADPRCRSYRRRTRARSGNPSACTAPPRRARQGRSSSSSREPPRTPVALRRVMTGGRAGRLGPLLHDGSWVGTEVAQAVPALDRVVLDLLGAVRALLHERPLDRKEQRLPRNGRGGPANAGPPLRRVTCRSAHMSEESDGGIPPLGGGALGGIPPLGGGALGGIPPLGGGVPPPIVPPLESPIWKPPLDCTFSQAPYPTTTRSRRPTKAAHAGEFVSTKMNFKSPKAATPSPR